MVVNPVFSVASVQWLSALMFVDLISLVYRLQCLVLVGPIFRWSTVLDACGPNLSTVYIQCLMVVINIVFTIIMVIVIRGSGRQCPIYKLYCCISSQLNVTLLSKMGHTDTVCDFSDICITVESATFSLK